MAKKSKNAVPKRIAGVKVPKKVRKSALGRILSRPEVLETLTAAGLAAASGMMAKREVGRDTPVGRALETANDRIKAAAHGGSDASQQFAYALGEAARSFSEAMRQTPQQRGDVSTLGERRQGRDVNPAL